ncbi:hypothetical protein LCGC14_0456580 [marine sediment metagenome]|uniref:Uncharacterized protein n=1 Tax=marine sediment metagenome TaxID=412755 RepID=A0A0F9V300_9ZZZZ|nr:hypothetical protein [Candidatus Aminicenantes bacterium]
MTTALATSLSTLIRIRRKVRRLTASPSPTQITDNDIDDYVNTFFLFDMPELIRLFNLRDIYEFYTDPDVEAYAFPRNEFIDISQPIYIAGDQSFYTQSREQFYRIYPQPEFEQDVGTGDGVTNDFTFNLSNPPVLRGFTYPPDTNVFSQLFIAFPNAAGLSIIARDDGTGGFVDEDGTVVVAGNINYTTGAVTNLVFPSVPPANAVLTAQYISYEPSRPEALLFYNDVFIVRPVPDKSYKISMEVQKRPTALLAAGNNPELEEWWQFLAYGGARKILEDRQDSTSIANIMPAFKEQQRLVLRRTTQQLVQERTATIYSEQVNFPYGNFNNRF